MKQSIKIAWDLMKKHSRKSIFFEYLQRLLILITIPFLITTGAVYFYHQKIMNAEMEYSLNRNFSQASFLANDIFEETKTNYSIIGSDNYVQNFLSTPSQLHNKNAAMYANNIIGLINNCIYTNSSIKTVYLYSFENQYVYSTSGGNYITSFQQKPWYINYEQTQKTDFIISDQTSNTENPSLYLAFGILTMQDCNGLLVFEISLSEIDKMLLGNLDPSSNEFYFLDQSNQIIYSTSRLQGDNAYKQCVFPAQPVSQSITISKQKGYLLAYANLPSQNIMLLYADHMNQYKPLQVNAQLMFILCLIISLVIPPVISFYISIRFYNSIAEIVARLNVVNTDTQQTDEEQLNELVFINRHIMNILDKNETVEKELVNKIAALKKAQSIALQTQLNPHFLFNTLNLIGLTSRVLAKGSNTATTTVTLLSELLTIALDTHEYIVPIHREISYAKKYLEIQQIKYKNNFNVVWNVHETILEYKTIKLILQPLIENSFVHGITPLENKSGLIIISILEENNNIIFKVEDNGIGISQEQLAEIRSALELKDMPETNHIGLVNVNLRIKLVFGDEYGIQIGSDQNGTCVQAYFPKSL